MQLTSTPRGRKPLEVQRTMSAFKWKHTSCYFYFSQCYNCSSTCLQRITDVYTIECFKYRMFVNSIFNIIYFILI